MKLKVRSLIKATISQFILSTLVLGLITALTGCGGGSYGTQMGGSPVTVRGAVVDEGGHPLIGIKILDLNSGEETDTNDKGQFEISALLADGADSVPLEIDGKSLVHVPASVGYVTEAAIARDAEGEFSLSDATPETETNQKSLNESEVDPISDGNKKEYQTGGNNIACDEQCQASRWAEKKKKDAQNNNSGTSGSEPETGEESTPQALAAICEESINKYVKLEQPEYLSEECYQHFNAFRQRYLDRLQIKKGDEDKSKSGEDTTSGIKVEAEVVKPVDSQPKTTEDIFSQVKSDSAVLVTEEEKVKE